jgi:hypothetical protein
LKNRNIGGKRVGGKKSIWKGRRCVRLTNGQIEIVALTGGGHIAALRFLPGLGLPAENALWEAPWPTMDPDRYRTGQHARRYGPPPAGQFLSSFTGHALCMDYFGGPSEEELRQNLPLHGEAAAQRWRIESSSGHTGVAMETSLPAAGLTFRRLYRLRKNESVVYIQEEVANRRPGDHYFHWTQHVTLGPPLLQKGESAVFLPGTRGKTWPHGYEGRSLLADSREFHWPLAPGKNGHKVNLSRPFVRRCKGFVAAVLLDPARELGFVVALNWRLGLFAGYIFRRNDFPWVAVWEENCARSTSPWNGTTQARGMEFGSTPMPVGKRESFFAGPLFDTPTFRCIPAKGTLRAGYLAFLAAAPGSWRRIRDVEIVRDAIVLKGPGPRDALRVRAGGLKEIGWR